MRRSGIEERLRQLERLHLPSGTWVCVELETGEEKEIPISEYVRNADRMRFLKMGRGFDPTFSDVLQVLSVWDKEADAEEKGAVPRE